VARNDGRRSTSSLCFPQERNHLPEDFLDVVRPEAQLGEAGDIGEWLAFLVAKDEGA